jgi:peptidylprolyl isomerase
MKRKARKSHTGRNAVLLILLLIVVISIVVIVYEMPSHKTDIDAPTYSTVSASSTKFSSSCTFSVLWNDDVNVSGYIFGTNNTGTFSNDTWVSFSSFASSTSAYSSVIRTLNGTIGNVVQWAFWCNDSGNHWQSTGLQNLFVDSNKVLLVTSMGNITIRLYDDMPITAGNFRNLVRQGLYDGTIFHRVVADFVIQGGAIEGVSQIQDELPNRHSNVRGSVAMAKTSQPNSATSQFFINLKDNSDTLDSNYSVFGTVVAGMDVVDAIGALPTDANEKPLQQVTIIKAQFIY